MSRCNRMVTLRFSFVYLSIDCISIVNYSCVRDFGLVTIFAIGSFHELLFVCCFCTLILSCFSHWFRFDCSQFQFNLSRRRICTKLLLFFFAVHPSPLILSAQHYWMAIYGTLMEKFAKNPNEFLWMWKKLLVCSPFIHSNRNKLYNTVISGTDVFSPIWPLLC